MFDDFDFDDFADLGLRVAPKSPDLVMTTIKMGRQGADRVQFNFRPDVLEEIEGLRYSIAFAVSRRTGARAFKIRSDVTGRFEALRPGRGDRRLLRCPMPVIGMIPAEGKAEPEYFVDRVGKAILVEVPDIFLSAKPKALPPPVEAVSHPSSAAVDEDTRVEIDRRLKSLLAGDVDLPPRIGGESFSMSERGILSALYRHPQVRREGLLAACHNPSAGEDDRDPKLVDVHLSKMRRRLQALGLVIERWDTGTYRFTPTSKERLRGLLEQPDAGP
jgi:hypothetical protein